MTFASINRHIISARRVAFSILHETATIESDNHVDTWCFGHNFVKDNFTWATCNLSGYDKKITSNFKRIGTGLTI